MQFFFIWNVMIVVHYGHLNCSMYKLPFCPGCFLRIFCIPIPKFVSMFYWHKLFHIQKNTISTNFHNSEKKYWANVEPHSSLGPYLLFQSPPKESCGSTKRTNLQITVTVMQSRINFFFSLPFKPSNLET